MANNVGIIGCGKIFPRHIEAIRDNPDFKLVSICDTNPDNLSLAQEQTNALSFDNHKNMINNSDVNFIVIATPNSKHFEQAIYALQNNCDVLIEKPATLNPNLIDVLVHEANINKQKVYCVLQVRLNSCIQNLKHLIDNDIIGTIRGVSLVQRWQRPREYFDDWRGTPSVGGGILHECGIHYLDVLCYLFGRPNIVSAKKYNTKHKNVAIEDTVYSIFDYDSFGGNIEVNISSEPTNLECSLSIMTDLGYIKLGGKAMNATQELSFLTEEKTMQVKTIMETNNTVGSPNSYGSYAGSCPNHPLLYKKIKDFTLQETKDVLYLIKDIYNKCEMYDYQEIK